LVAKFIPLYGPL